jgi:iron(III) transport system ATP-binding protein
VAELLALHQISKRFAADAPLAVDGLSLTVAEGEILALLGPSGCGKTTTLRLIAGFEAPDAGTVAVRGAIVAGPGQMVAPEDRGIGIVFQDYALFPHLTVADNVAFGLQRLPRPARRERVARTLEMVDLADLAGRYPHELSGGQQQRVAVARALVLEPSVLLFDEPLSNLDARLRRQMRDEIRELQQRLSLTVVYVTHDQAEAMAVSDRIIVMNRAVIAQEGTPRELYEKPRDAFVAGFMGDANRVRGTLARRDAVHGDVTLGGLRLDLPHRGFADGDVALSIRPESIELRSPGTTPLRGVVRKAAYLGGVMEYTLDTPIGELFAISTAVDAPLAVGSEVSVALAQHGVVAIPPPGEQA